MKSNALAARELRVAVESSRRPWHAATAGACFALSLLALSHVSAAAPPASGDVADADLLRGMAALSVGRGLRFNNPYRLDTPLGDTAESVSLSATYLDLSLAMLLAGSSIDQGVSLSALFALDGIGQFGVTPSYLAQLPISRRFAARGRLGVPLVVAPDATIGLEASLGSNFLIAHGLGITSELVASVFFGAATEETSVTTIPMLSLQVGIMFEHGVL
jgi:hypothetical protein